MLIRKVYPAARLAMCLFITGMLLPATATADNPARGSFLIATHDLVDPNFAEAVILLLHYDEDGAFGVIINRRSGLSPVELLPEINELGRYDGPLYFGGPVSVGSLVVLIRGDDAGGSAEHVIDGVHALSKLDDLQRVRRENRYEENLRIYAGYAGWGPGQLDNELARDDWHVRPAEGAFVFTDDPKLLWAELVPQRQPIQVRLTALPPLSATIH